MALGIIATVIVLAISLSIENVALGASTRSAQSNKSNKSLSQVKAAVNQAKKEADQAAAQYAEAYGALEKVGDRLTEVQSQIDASEATMVQLEEKAAEYVLNAYIRSSDTSDKDPQEVIDENRRTQMMSTVAAFDSSQLTQLSGLKEDLAITREELSTLQEDRKKRVDELDKQKKALDEKLQSAVKAQKDLEAKLAADARASRQRSQQARTASNNSSSGTSSGPAGQIINPGNGALTCPIQGPLAFTNDWGRPRSGGRTHKGNDLFSPRGTPNVAIVSGSVMFRNEGTGGLSAYLSGDNGVTYYYTHLNGYAGGNRRVQQGEVIGYTGSTGNASGGSPHTHFEMRMGGANGNRVNPYTTLRSIC